MTKRSLTDTIRYDTILVGLCLDMIQVQLQNIAGSPWSIYGGKE